MTIKKIRRNPSGMTAGPNAPQDGINKGPAEPFEEPAK